MLPALNKNVYGIPTLLECRKALNNMIENKAPEQDVLPVEFY